MTDEEFVEHTKKEFPNMPSDQVNRMLLWYKVFTDGEVDKLLNILDAEEKEK